MAYEEQSPEQDTMKEKKGHWELKRYTAGMKEKAKRVLRSMKWTYVTVPRGPCCPLYSE